MKKIILVSFLFLAVSGFSALSPLSQSIRELKALLDDSHLQAAFGSGDPILQIVRTEKGFSIATSHQVMQVELVYGKPMRPGPVPFQLHFYEPVAQP
jgi:hypothetical protein